MLEDVLVMRISLIIYHLLNILRRAELMNAVGVKEMLVNLSKIYVVEDKLGKELPSPALKKTRTIIEKMGITYYSKQGISKG